MLKDNDTGILGIILCGPLQQCITGQCLCLWTATVTVTILMDIVCGLLRYRAVTSESSAQGVDAPLVKTMGPRKLLKMLELGFFSSALSPRSTAALCSPRVTVAARLCPFWSGCTPQRCCVSLC